MSDGELGIYWGYRRISHPLERTPAVGGAEGRAAKRSSWARESRCATALPVTVPFAVPLREHAPPTGAAVHSSLVWFLEATLMYSKWTQAIEKVRRQIVVVNAP